MALGQTPQPNDTVLAWKPQTPYMHGESGWPSMPHNLYTNTVFWGSAKTPFLSPGTTNFNAICFSKNSGGNLVQPILNSQFSRLETNGVWVWRLDGIDDQGTINIPFLTNVTYVIYSQTITNAATTVGLGLGQGTSGVNREHVVNGAAIWANYTWRRDSSSDQVVFSNSNYPLSGKIECFVLRRTLQDFSITTRLGKNTRTTVTPWSSAPRINGIGRTDIAGGYTAFFAGDIAEVIIFDRVITDDEANYFIQRNPQ